MNTTPDIGWFTNLAIVAATTTNTNDSVKITSANGSALSSSNPGYVRLPSTATAGQTITLPITSDVTMLLTGNHFGHGGTGDLTGVLIRVFAINDNGAAYFGIAYLGGRNTFLASEVSDTNNVTTPEGAFSTHSGGISTSNTCRELGFVRANFDDTGGAAEDLFAVQTGVGDVNTGITADGYTQPWNPGFGGFSVNPTVDTAICIHFGRIMYLDFTTSSAGTSNATSFTINAPAKAARPNKSLWAEGQNNSVVLAVPGPINSVTGSITMNVYRDVSSLGWTAALSKYIDFTKWYEIGPAASFLN